MDVWDFWKNKMMVQPKMAKDMLDSMHRMRYGMTLYVEITLSDLRANCQCNSSR
jgi:hypothetical protein